MRGPVAEGTLLWEPPAEVRESANVSIYLRWLAAERGLRFAGYDDLWRWSVRDLDGFWSSIWDFNQVSASRPFRRVLADDRMPGARFSTGAELNFAEHALRHTDDEQAAIVAKREGEAPTSLSWADLRGQVAAVAERLRALGVGPGDRVAAYLPNCPQAAVAFLATASLGAIWSSCSPDFGPRSVVDRLRQIEPRVLIAADGYRYGGRDFDRRHVVRELQGALPALERTVLVPYLDSAPSLTGLVRTELWDASGSAPLRFEQVPFDHPLWVLYSSGTTGMPKGIVQGHGGILVGLLAAMGVHLDLKPPDRFFWFTTTGWVMWNITVSALLFGSTIVLYDGSPGYPGPDALWEVAEETGTTILGTSAAYITACAKAGVEPGRSHGLGSLRALCYTGSPLVPDLWGWAYEHVRRDLWMSSISGGTDVCVPFVGGLPTLPVRAGEFQCRCLGVEVQAFDPRGRPLLDEVGELVVTRPMPSMPVCFWNDSSGERYRDSYFDVYPGAWRHGDWIKITRDGRAVIYGRSDSTINRMGVRVGSAEIYRVVEELPEVLDSLVVDLTELGRETWMPLFVVLREGRDLDDALTDRIRSAVREELSPRHVPDAVFAIPAVPRTLNNKKLEVPVKRILSGVAVEAAVNPGSMSNPESLQFFVELAARCGPGGQAGR